MDCNHAMMILLAGSTNVAYMSYNRKETDKVKKKGVEISRYCPVWEIANPDVQLLSVIVGQCHCTSGMHDVVLLYAHEDRSDAEKGKAQYLTNSY